MTFLRIVIPLYLSCLSMILSENRFPLFRIMLLEGHAYSPLFAPDDAAWPLQLVHLHSKGETVGNKERGDDFKRRAGFRDVADGAVNGTAAELDRSGLQYAAALRGAGR